MNLLRLNIFGLFFFGCSLFIKGQTTQIIRYTMQEGLPANSIYRTLIDKKGFLWIAGENGVTRYDGRTFKNYTTVNGLPDNEVTEIMTDSSGRLWALPFRKKPAYYNEATDRFENSDSDPELGKIELGINSFGNVLKHGGIGFINTEKTIYVFKDGKVTVYPFLFDKKIKAKPNRIIDISDDTFILIGYDSLRMVKKGQLLKAIPFGYVFDWSEYVDSTLFVSLPYGILAVTFNNNGEIIHTRKQEYPFRVKVMCYTGKNLAITSPNGNTYIVDPVTLELKANLLNDVIVRSVLEDPNGNYWLSTKDEGLIKIQEKRISSYTENIEMLKNFNAIIKTREGKIIAGNNKGELYSYDGLYTARKIMLNTPDNKSDTWVRDIIELGDDLYVATQTGSFFINKKTFTVKKSFLGLANKSTKTAYRLNDTILLMGGHGFLFVYNTRTGKFTDSIAKRVTAIGANDKQQIYIGSTDGLYRKDKDSLFYFGKNDKAFTYRIVSIVNTHDGLMWIGRSSDSMLILKNDKRVGSIPLGTTVPGTICKVMYSHRPGEVWIGTDKGLNKINYRFEDNKLQYQNLFFSMGDGLIGPQVNDIMIFNDTVYAATSAGISYLPINLQLPLNDLPTFITRVSVNNSDTATQSSYTLPYSKNNIRIEFSSVDLTGFNPFFEYSINNGNWQQVENNFLALQNQPPGSYTIRIRSLKRNGSPSLQQAVITFKIKKPIWKTTWFQVLTGLIMVGLFLFLNHRRNRLRQQKAIDKITTEKKIAELEMQALKAQINPHFVFNCLNSIKGFIYEKDYIQADTYLDKFSDLLRSTMDNADASIISLDEEIKYLNNYLQLEKLRFVDKFEYRIDVGPAINTSNTFVPAMLLQPYVENAIRHGVRHLKDRKGRIIISFEQGEGLVVCKIDDNGIGRTRAAELKSAMHIEYQSRGMQLSRRRAELYNIEQIITDKKDISGNASGTTIILKIPATLKL